MSLSLLLHEMATNALKYGALSVPNGKVEIRWTVKDEHFALTWRELGGPAPAIPSRQGFGSKLIAMGINGSRDVVLEYPSDGLFARVGASVAAMSN